MLENSEDALKRELAEELGVPMKGKRLIWSVEISLHFLSESFMKLVLL